MAYFTEDKDKFLIVRVILKKASVEIKPSKVVEHINNYIFPKVCKY
jgi:hypothetical protein